MKKICSILFFITYYPAYFNNIAQRPATPQFITVAFRYVTMPSSLRIVNNFTKNFDFDTVRKFLK